MRSKLVFGFVVVSVGSMLAFGAIMYMTADRMINQATADQLDGLAESSVGTLESIAEGWRERVHLIASRTQMRVSLRDHEQTANPAAAERIERILNDARTSARSVVALAVYDLQGRVIASSESETDPAPTLPPSSLTSPPGEAEFLGVSFVQDEAPRIRLSIVLALDSEPIGVLYVALAAHRLAALTADYTGLGETGEIMVVARYRDGLRTLHPVRDTTRATGEGWIRLPDGDELALRALEDNDEDDDAEVIRGGVADYRGRDVWAATRHLERPDYGLIVKYDTEEKRSGINEFRERLFAVALSLSGIGFMVAVFLGFRFAGPILELAAAAKRIHEGDLTARALVKREDEIGLLAQTFNETADALEKQVTELHEFHRFFDVSLDLLCIAGTDGYFKRTNPAFTKVLGWTFEELLARPFFDLVHPDDLAATQHEIEKLSQGIPTISFVNRFRCADGTWKRLHWNSYPDPKTGLLYAVARETSASSTG